MQRTAVCMCVCICVCVCAHTLMLSCFWLFPSPWTVSCQAHRSMGFSRHEYWTRLPISSPGDLPNAGIKPASLDLLHWQVGFLPLAPPGKHWKPEEQNQQAFLKFSVQRVWREPVNFLLLPIKKKKFRKPKAIKRICYWWVINYCVCWVHKLVRFLWLFIWGKKWDLKVWMITFR